MQKPLVSIVLATHNRAATLARTLNGLGDCGLAPSERELIVIDNNSTDGTRALLQNQRHLHTVLLDQNLGRGARAIGVEQAAAPIVLLLDDDSFPRPGCVYRMLSAFERFPRLAAAGFTVRLPNGQQESVDLPGLFHPCGVGLRVSAVQTVGGLDDSFGFGEDTDLALRLLSAGERVERFADLQVDHLKTPSTLCPNERSERRICSWLRIASRYLPDKHLQIYRDDWHQLFQAQAKHDGALPGFLRGARAGLERAAHERETHAAFRMSGIQADERLGWSLIEERMKQMQAAGMHRIGLVDASPTLYAFHRGAQLAGLQVRAIYDDALAGVLPSYRETPIQDLNAGLAEPLDALVVSNANYAQAVERTRYLRARTVRPVFNWFTPPAMSSTDDVIEPSVFDRPSPM